MGFINTCNNPLNPELHASYATCIWKQINKTLSTPLLLGEIFCTPWILSGKFYFLEDMLWLFFNSMYVFTE